MFQQANIIVYFTPVLMLAALLLILFTYLAPVVMLHGQVALLTVTPSGNGATLYAGLLGSCSKSSNTATLYCTASSIFPTYDTSVLPSNVVGSILAPPPLGTAALMAIALVLTFIFFVMYVATTFRNFMGKMGDVWEQPRMQRVCAWIGLFAFLFGLALFFILRMYFGKTAFDFNQSQGSSGPQLIANTGNAFLMVWIGYGFFAVPVIISMVKGQVLATWKH